jgi:hypothetical protein
MCTTCRDRWQLFLQQQKLDTMKEDKKEKPVVKQEVATVQPYQKPDINKVIEDRRKAIQNGKTINK